MRSGPLFLLLLLSWSALSQKLSRTEFGEAMDAVKQIRSFASQKPTLFIGIGRSPALLTELLKIEQSMAQKTLNLPLTAFRPRDMTLKEKKKLFQYFDSFIEGHKKVELALYKEIFLIDYSQSGESLIAAHKYFQLYLKEKNILPAKVSPIFVVSSSMPKVGMKKIREHSHLSSAGDVNFIRLRSDGELARRLALSGFDQLSEYEQFDFGGADSSQKKLALSTFPKKRQRTPQATSIYKKTSSSKSLACLSNELPI